MLFKIAARTSALSRAQTQEILTELRFFYPQITFEEVFVQTTGDIDQKTSLRTLEKTDFFTKEVDALILNGACRIAIHSAKDLPDPLTQGLAIVALTKGLDSSDSLVFRKEDSLDTLKPGALVATSSQRREEAALQLRPDFSFRDIRGTIEQRLSLLEKNEADGVVVAEAALIRLGLSHLNRIALPGATVPFQGQLAVVARSDDVDMKNLFKVIDSR